MPIDGERVLRDNALTGIRDQRIKVVQHEDELTKRVAAAREAGVSWARIGDALGTSRQSAWERYARAIGPARAGSATD